jgi:CubicO group peptidase (beta-lactamase class C family)
MTSSVRRAAAGVRAATPAALLLAGAAAAASAQAPAAPPPSAHTTSAAAPGAQAPSATAAAVDRVVAAAESAGFSGVVLVADRDTVRYARAVGLADRGRRRPHALASVWRWASVTKQVTAVLVMQEVDAGRLSLESTVAELLPEFTGPTGRQVTVRRLLQHTSGLPDPEDTPRGADGVPAFYRAARPATASGAPSVDGAAARGTCAGADARPPGGGFRYNNCDYLVLGAILERVTGVAYPALVERRIAAPLGLRTLRVRAPGAAPSSPVVAYAASGDPEPAIDAGTYGAAGALHGTADDLLAFDRALLDGRLVSPASRARLWEGDPRLGYAALGAWAFPARLAGCEGGLQLVERRGAIGGVQVRNVLVPARGVAVIVFANTARTEFGEVWQGRGFTHDLLRAALCA